MSENDKTTVYLLGDSITQGLGSKKVNFTGKLAGLLGEGYELFIQMIPADAKTDAAKVIG